MKPNITLFSLKTRLEGVRTDYSNVEKQPIFSKPLQGLVQRIESILGSPGPADFGKYGTDSHNIYGRGILFSIGELSWKLKSLANADDAKLENIVKRIFELQSYVAHFIGETISAIESVRGQIERITVESKENLENKEDILVMMTQDIEEFKRLLGEEEKAQPLALAETEKALERELAEHKQLLLESRNELKIATNQLEVLKREIEHLKKEGGARPQKREYDKKFKEEVVRMYNTRRLSVKQLSEELGVPRSTLSSWIKRASQAR